MTFWKIGRLEAAGRADLEADEPCDCSACAELHRAIDAAAQASPASGERPSWPTAGIACPR